MPEVHLEYDTLCDRIERDPEKEANKAPKAHERDTDAKRESYVEALDLDFPRVTLTRRQVFFEVMDLYF